jgi:hypothetical protein
MNLGMRDRELVPPGMVIGDRKLGEGGEGEEGEEIRG